MACLRKLALRIINYGPFNKRSAVNYISRHIETYRQFSTRLESSTEFGFLFDIDGVISRGRSLLPHSVSAFKYLTNEDGKFLFPTVFVTNAGNSSPETKAEKLSEWLGIEVDPDQVVLSYSPLKLFSQFHKKHVLVSGQGSEVKDISEKLGFTNVTTVDTLRNCFPLLDTIDNSRRKAAPCAFESYFPKIDAVLLLGEPLHWEVGLQLILDVLMSNGHPWKIPPSLPYPHLPVLACNMDLVWMSEAPSPRFGHGCFLHCLEALYKRLTGLELHYTALVGKPSEITYHYAEYELQRQAHKMNFPPVSRMYCIGDNPVVDIFGANLFSQTLKRNRNRTPGVRHKTRNYDQDPCIDSLTEDHIGIACCESILVSTGVYDGSQNLGNHLPKVNNSDFVMDNSLCIPSISSVHNVLEAVLKILKRELHLEKQMR